MHKLLVGLGSLAAAAMAATAVHAQDTVKIGMIAAFTGQFADTAAQIDQGIKLYETDFTLPRAIDLAVNAIEVADLVGIEIYPDRDPARAAREHRVDETVGFKRPLMLREQRMRDGVVGSHSGLF